MLFRSLEKEKIEGDEFDALFVTVAATADTEVATSVTESIIDDQVSEDTEKKE